MAKFNSETRPSLVVYVGPGEPSVRFKDGEAEATGRAADVLRGLDPAYGVTEVKQPQQQRSRKGDE